MARQPQHLAERQRTLGRHLAALREAAGLYQVDIARAVPCHRTTVTHAEAGSQLPDAHFWEIADRIVGANGTLITSYDETDPTAWWARILDHSYIEVQRARSLTLLGAYDAAVESFRKTISRLPCGYRRDRGVYLAREAVAHIGNNGVEQAAAVDLRALAIGAETGSARIIGELKYLDTALREFSTTSSVAGFHDAMHETYTRWCSPAVEGERG